MVTRRRFLCASGRVAGAAGLIGAASNAQALSLEEPSATVAALYHRADQCATGAYHRQLLADVDALLAGQPVPAEEKETIRAQVMCPICGCPVEPS